MRVLVTGGAGFIGSHLVDGLLYSGLEVGILDDFSSGAESNLTNHLKDVRIHRGSITNEEFVSKVVQCYDVVLHQAARISVTRSVKNPIFTNTINVDGTLNLLVAARKAGVERFVYASSSSVYGDTPALPKVESMPPHPLSPYAVSKLAAEAYCGVFASIHGLKTVSLRYFNVYGPRQSPGPYSGVIPTFIDTIKNGKAPLIYGDGLQTRDFTYVRDVVQANLLAMTKPVRGGEVFNVGSSKRITINDLAETILRLLKRPDLKPIHLQERAGDVKHSLADITRISHDLGYSPKYHLDEGIAETLGNKKTEAKVGPT